MSTIPTSWTIANWFIDPVNGSDGYTGQNATFTSGNTGPLQTLAQLYARYGTYTPVLAQATTITWVNSTPITDPYLLSPTLQNAGSITLQGTPTVTTTTTITVFTAQNRAAGTPATITASGISSWTAGTPIVDTTAGAIFFVAADLGSGVAQITLPVNNALGFQPAPVTIANGETIQLQSYQTVYASQFQNNGAIGPTLNRLNVNALSSTEIKTLSCAFNGCQITGSFLFEGGGNTRYSACAILSVTGAAALQGGSWAVTAGAIFGNFGSLPGLGLCTLNGDVLVLGTGHSAGYPAQFRFGACYLTGAFINQNQGVSFLSIADATYGPSGRPVIWGPATFNVGNGAEFFVGSATAAQLFLNTGGLQLDGVTTGSTYNNVTGVWTAGVTVNPANVDANGAIINPNTGSKYHT